MTSDPSSIPSPDSNDSKRCVVNQSLLHNLPKQSSAFQANREAGDRPSKRKINTDTQSTKYSIASDERHVSLMQQQPLEAPNPTLTTKTDSTNPSKPSSSDMTSNGNPTIAMDPQKVLLAYNPGESSAPLYLDHKFPLQQQSPVAAASTVPVASTGQKTPVAVTTANSSVTNGAGRPNTVAQSYSLMDIHTVSMWTEYGVLVPLTTTTVTTTTTTMTTTSALPTSSTGSPVTPNTPSHTTAPTAADTKKSIVEQHSMTSSGFVPTMLTMDPHMIYLMRMDAYQKTATTTTSTIASKLMYLDRPATQSQRPASTTVTNDRKQLRLVTTKTTTTTTTTQTENIMHNNRMISGMGNNAVEMYSRYGIPIIPPTTAAVTTPTPPSSSSSRRLQSAVAGEEPSVDEKKSSETDTPNHGRLASTPTYDRSSSSNINGSIKKQSEFERIAAEAKAFRLAEQERIAREKQEELEAQQLAKQQEQERVAQQGNQFRISEEQRILQEKKDMQQKSVLLKQNEIKQVGQQNVEFRISEEARIAEEKKKRLMKNGNEELDSLATNAIVTEEQAKWNKEVEEHERRHQEKIEEDEARMERLKAEEIEKENTRIARLQKKKREEEERVKAEEAARIAAEEKRVQEEKEAARITEEKREAEAKAAEEARLAREKAAAEEAARLEDEKEANRIAEEKRLAEEVRIAAEEKRVLEDKAAEEARLEKEKAALLEAAEAARRAEEQRPAHEKAASEKEKAAEAARLKAEETARMAEENRLAKEKAAEAAKLEKEKAAEAARLKAEEEARIAKEERIAKEQAAEKANLARMAEEKRLADAARVVEEQAAEAAKRKVQEDARIKEAKRVAEEAQIAEEKRLAREVAAAEARRQAEFAAYERRLAENRAEQARRDAERLETLKQREFEASRLRLEAAKKRKAEQIAAENARRVEQEAKTTAVPPKVVPGQTAKTKQPEPPAAAFDHGDVSTKLVMLTSTSSGNRLQAGNQKRALSLLRAHGIEPEVIDGSDPKNIDVRNQYLGISGIKGNYPQFFAITELETTFVGNVETLEFMNDAGTLSRKSILSSSKCANHGAAEKQKKQVVEQVEVQLQKPQSIKTTAGAKKENNEGNKTLTVVRSQVGGEPTVDAKKKMKDERSTPSEVSQTEGRKEKSSNRERYGILSATKNDGGKAKEHQETRTVEKPKGRETAGNSSAGQTPTSDLHADAGGNDRLSGVPAPTVDGSNQAKTNTDLSTTSKKNSKKKASSSMRKKPQKSKASKKGKPKGKSRGASSLDFEDDFDFDKELPKRRFGGFKIGATEVAVGVVAVSAILGYWFRSNG